MGSEAVFKRPANSTLAQTLTADPKLLGDMQERQSQKAVARMLSALGAYLQEEKRDTHELDDLFASIVAELTESNRAALGQFISNALKSWDTDALVDGIEAEVGADLQFVRINGTVLGAILGGCLFAIEALLG